ncbi:BatA domain-containing protein [Gemmata sp. JC717]|uniref:BatA domain-containing protein n=1 Tax=Gemmata algarum TaxID=2975278 RepID=UPI0021BB3361|nr:BatA domain-containing protein [Gemmata algarum]MDY3554620.1 BatA domain-containing protein [Gemmata algarum]
MPFQAPLMLFGAAAVTVPLALHFFYRARYKPLPWGPMKLLKEAVEQTSRRLKFQERLLLLLRCLALILLALALARPALDSVSGVASDGPVDAVLVFDTSYSMAARDGEKTRLERAKDAAVAVLDALPDQSSVQIYACADRAQALGPVSRYNRDQAKQLVRSIEVTSLSTDVLPGLTDALAAAESGTAPAKEIYVFSDMQKSGFERQQPGVRAKCEEAREKKAGLVFVRCGNPERKIPNVSVVDVKLLAAIPHTRTRVPFVVTVKNTGPEPVRGIKVSLELDGKAVERDATQIDQIDPGATAEVTLTGGLDEAGSRRLAVYADGDGLDGDNVLYKIVGVRDKVNALLVAHPFAGLPATDAGDWFVRKALVPFDTERERDKIEKYFIATESVRPDEVGPDKLAGKDIVYLLNAPVRTDDPFVGMPPAFVSQLAEFVKGGGGLVIGAGPLVNPGDYNRVLGRAGAGLLPVPLGPDLPAATAEAPFRPAAESIDDRDDVFGKVKPYADWIDRATFTRMLHLDDTAPDAAGGRVRVRTTDNRPLVASRVVGDGEVLFFAAPLDESWGSRLMADGQFAVPLTTYIVSHLTGRKVPGGARTAGDTLTWAPPVVAPGYELIKPRPRTGKGDDGRNRQRVKLGGAKAGAGARPVVSTADSLVAGEYAIVPVGGTEADGATFAVNPDLRETDNLEPVSDSELEKMLGYRPTVIQAGAGTETAIRERRTHGEWTEWVLLALLLLLMGEATWAWFCGRAW